MLIALACVTLLALTALALLAQQQKAHRESEAQWAIERRELCSRIQAPDRIPVTPSGTFVVPEREPDEWAKVGQIDVDPDYGLGDDG